MIGARLIASVVATGWLLATPLAGHAAAPIQRVVSPGGIEAWLVEEYSIPMVAMEISFGGGASLDPDSEAGAAGFMAALLSEGAGDLDALAYAEAVESTGMRSGISAGRDAVGLSARMLTETLDESVALLRLALHEPRFEPAAIERVRAQILSSLRSAEADPDQLASDAFMAAAFPDHPYGRETDGTIETVSAMTADDLRRAHARHLTRADLKIGVVGAIDAEALGAMLDNLLGDLPAGDPLSDTVVTPQIDGGVDVVSFPAPQSRIVFGHAGPLRDDPDFIPIYVMNHILGGGGFSSILMTEVREKRGLAYGAYSYLASFDDAGMILGRVGTANERVGETLSVIRDEWRRVAEGGITQAQLDAAKRYLTGAYALRFDSNAAIAGILVGLQRADLPIDYPETRNALVEAVTLEDIQRVAAEWLDPEALTFVIAGQPEGITVGQ